MRPPDFYNGNLYTWEIDLSIQARWYEIWIKMKNISINKIFLKFYLQNISVIIFGFQCVNPDGLARQLDKQ